MGLCVFASDNSRRWTGIWSPAQGRDPDINHRSVNGTRRPRHELLVIRTRKLDPVILAANLRRLAEACSANVKPAGVTQWGRWAPQALAGLDGLAAQFPGLPPALLVVAAGPVNWMVCSL